VYRFRDLLGVGSYDWEGSRLAGEGLFVDLEPWGFHLFEMKPMSKSSGMD
jgi:hypothetical protein